MLIARPRSSSLQVNGLFSYEYELSKRECYFEYHEGHWDLFGVNRDAVSYAQNINRQHWRGLVWGPLNYWEPECWSL